MPSVPPLETVLRHCARLFPNLYQPKLASHSTTGVNSPANVALLTKATTAIYQFLSEQLGTEVSADASPCWYLAKRSSLFQDEEMEKPDWLASLREIPLILVEGGRKLAPATMVRTEN